MLRESAPPIPRGGRNQTTGRSSRAFRRTSRPVSLASASTATRSIPFARSSRRRGAGGAVRFDLGLVPALPYYTGVVFQVTVADLGFPIAAGGRYDGLLARFGADRPATGLGIAVPHLHQALVAAGWQAQAESPLLLLAPHVDDATTLRVAVALRGAGIAVAIGDIAEGAGQDVRRARVIDDGHVEYEGVARELEAVIAALTGGPR